MQWIEMTVYAAEKSIEPLTQLLGEIGISGFIIDEPNAVDEFLSTTELHWDYVDENLIVPRDGEPYIRFFLPDIPETDNTIILINQILSRFRENTPDCGSLKIEKQTVRDEDWENNWKAYFKTFEIGERLVIKPSWESYDNSSGRIVLEIDPKLCFGTGTHETTQLCLTALEKYLKNNDRLLDVGCGSGILSVAGLLLGASYVFGVDIDPLSITTSTENVRINGILDDRFHAICGDMVSDKSIVQKIGGEYNIITANIVADVLISMAHIFPSFLVKDGILIASGIIEDRLSDVSDKLSQNGFCEISRFSQNDWWCLVVKKQGDL